MNCTCDECLILRDQLEQERKKYGRAVALLTEEEAKRWSLQSRLDSVEDRHRKLKEAVSDLFELCNLYPHIMRTIAGELVRKIEKRIEDEVML